MDEELHRIREMKMKEMLEVMATKKHPDVIHIDEANFQKVITSHPSVVIDFWAEWCGPCRMVGPIIEKLAQEFRGKVVFGKCNTDQNPRITTRFGISAIPTLLLFSHGTMVQRIIGAYPEESLRAQVIRAFGSQT